MAKKILIIDDDPNIVKYLETLFADNNYETVTATDGANAYDVLVNEKPDLITLDLDMPNEWGPRFYRKMTKDDAYKGMPVIVISGLSGSKYAIKNAVASLKKPFDREELMQIVKDTIG